MPSGLNYDAKAEYQTKVDISVVGAGPVGCFAAKTLSKENKVTLFEEHSLQPIQCAGLLSKSGFDALGVKPRSFVKNKITGALMYSPSGSLLEISPRETKAYVVDRREFDEHMLGLAVDSGVSFVNDSVKSASKNVLRVSGGEFKHDRLVLATGTNYTLQNKMGLNVPKEFLIGAQYDLKVDCHSDFVELHFIVPDFFAWVIPVDGFARVGLCSHGNPRPLLDGFVKKLRSGGRLKSDRVLGKTYGIIPVHSPRMRTQYGNIMLVGDSAGQVKATTGGGVVLGCMAAELTKYEDYESRWRKKIGRELYLHLLIHRFMGRIPPEKIDLLFSILHDNKDVIEEKGDMDLASKTVFALLAKPRFLYEAALNLPAFMASLLYHKS